MTDMPALLIDAQMDIIAANTTADAVFDFTPPNQPGELRAHALPRTRSPHPI